MMTVMMMMMMSYRSNTHSLSAQAALGAQNQELLLVRTERVFGQKALLKQPNADRKSDTKASCNFRESLFGPKKRAVNVAQTKVSG